MRLALILPILLLIGCDAGTPMERVVLPFGETDELVVITRQSPTTRYINPSGKFSGIENDLVELFAKDLGVKVRFVDKYSLSAILPKLSHRYAHFAAAGLTASPETRTRFKLAPSYQRVQQVVAFNADGDRPQSIRDLTSRKVAVLKGSRAAALMKELKRLFPALRWNEFDEGEVHDLLAQLADNKLDAVVADANTVDVARNIFPNVQRAFALGEPEPLAWVFPEKGDAQLFQRANAFFARVARDGTLKRLLDQYYGHLHRMESVDIEHLIEKIQSELPKYRKHFQNAEEVTGIDWRMLAAIGFQESHWNPLATSPTGVRGIMMLTEETADHLGISNRLDPRQSILAGARYFADLKERLPDQIQEPDRTYFALAAYNLGIGHLEDARILAQRMKLNPNLWVDVKKTLPMLAQPEHWPNLKYGFARGGEGVILTENIRNYYDVLGRFQPPYTPGFSLPAQLRSPNSLRERLPDAWYSKILAAAGG